MLAEAAIFGLPVDRLLRTTNGVERDLLVAIHKEAVGVYEDLQMNLARKIVKEYSDAQRRGGKG
jgi:hypothetical protein